MALNMKSLIANGAGFSSRRSATGSGEDDAPEGMAPPPIRIPRSQSIQRLQIGLSGLAAMVLLVGLASIVKDRVDQTEETVIAEAGDVPEVVDEPALQSDPLADAGLVPDLPAEPVAETTAVPAPAQSPPTATNAPQ